MIAKWQAADTSTHQDHVIAHVIDATVLGYFVVEEAIHVLLDIGFIWTIFLDGEMALMLHPIAVAELHVDATLQTQIKQDIDLLLGNNPSTKPLTFITAPAVECRIVAVDFFADEDKRRLVVTGEQSNLAIETSLVSAEIQVYEC
jgi:hypothetical protein